jgi:hypothetical protein
MKGCLDVVDANFWGIDDTESSVQTRIPELLSRQTGAIDITDDGRNLGISFFAKNGCDSI